MFLDYVPLRFSEAIEIYLKHLADDGVLAFHISTMHLDLYSVVWKLAEHFNLESAWIEGFEDEQQGALSSDWILLAWDNDFLNSKAIEDAESLAKYRRKDVMLWTDDHINVLEILKKSSLSQ